MVEIITIEREYGCGGGEIARKLADRLGWKLWDELLTCEIARLSHCKQSEVEAREERVDPLYCRLFKSILRGSFEGSLNVHRLKLLDADSILRITQQVVRRNRNGHVFNDNHLWAAKVMDSRGFHAVPLKNRYFTRDSGSSAG